MTAKKRWLNNFCNSQEPCKKTQLSISWSSSESEDEFNKYIHARKKKKTTFDADIWIKPKRNEMLAQKYVTDFAYPSTSNNCCGSFSISNQSELDQVMPSPPIFEVEKRYNIEDSESNIANCTCESIINKLKLEESPILNRNPIKKSNISPILGKTGFLRNILRSRHKLRKKSRNVQKESFRPSIMSPDLFTIESTQFIECDSPEYDSNCSLSITDSNISQSNQLVDIDPFPSPCKPQDINSSTDNSLNRTNSSFLYHQPMPKKKKYKKGGLASLLQKTLHIQKTRIAIWQHEIYTKKIDFTNIVQEEIIEFTIIKYWKEYGSLLLECECSNKVDTSNDLFASGSTNIEQDIFIIVIGFNSPLNILYEMGHKYKLFPPYSRKYILYKLKNVLCFFNVTKIILTRRDDYEVDQCRNSKLNDT